VNGGSGGRQAELQKIWALLLDRSDEIADSIVVSLEKRPLPPGATLTPTTEARLRENVRAHIRRGLETLAGLSEGPPVDLWRETGRRRAREGMPLDLVLTSFIGGARLLWLALVDHLDDVGEEVDDRLLLEAGRVVWDLLERQNEVVVEAYRLESGRQKRRDVRRQQAVLDLLVEGRGTDPDFAREARDVLGVRVDDRVGCLVALSQGPSPDRLEPLDSLVPVEDALDRAGIVARWHVRSGNVFGLLSGELPDAAALARLVGRRAPGRIGVAISERGVAGFATAFQLALRSAESMPRTSKGAVAVVDRLPEVLLAGSPQAAQLVLEETLGPLLALPDGQAQTLLTTLEVLLKHDGSPTAAADELFCHRNTVIYRMKQIEQLTGRSLTDSRDKMLLGLGLLARDTGPS
jgi:hypothetical protein